MNAALGRRPAGDAAFLDRQADLARQALKRIGRGAMESMSGSLTSGGAARRVMGTQVLPALGVALGLGAAVGLGLGALCDREGAAAVAQRLAAAAGIAPAGLDADGVPDQRHSVLDHLARIAHAIGLG